ncbi:MAG: hypothetical protein KatS3mg002_0244 [Candidatus Woesearchaeota archaeon]|nr:MAG: hypothetical protein KatS3mg002_0244 [Candidatus Woesearchaeota archaeon]
MNVENTAYETEKSTQAPYSFYYYSEFDLSSRYQFEEIITLKNQRTAYGQIIYQKFYILNPGIYNYKFSSVLANLAHYEYVSDEIKRFLLETYNIDSTVFPKRGDYIPHIFNLKLAVPFQIFVETKVNSAVRKIHYFWSLTKTIDLDAFILSPFPNIWGSGEICTGNINKRHIVDAFFENEFNRDITNNFEFYNSKNIYPFRNIFEWAYESAHDPLFWKKNKYYKSYIESCGGL